MRRFLLALWIGLALTAVPSAEEWPQFRGPTGQGHSTVADGRIYFLTEEGVSTVIAPGKVFSRLAVNQLDGATLASIAVSCGSLFIRSHSHLYRIGGRQGP